MNRLLASSLSVLLLTGATAPTVFAGEMPQMPRQMMADIRMQITPFNLVFLAYQGYLEDEGIPKAGKLLDKTDSGAIKAEDLVKAAIKTGRLPNSSLTNKMYLSAVQYELEHLGSN